MTIINQLYKNSFHLPHEKLLGTNHVGKTRHEALEIRSLKKYIKFRQFCAYILVAQFVTKIQSHYFGGNKYWFINGVALEYNRKYDNRSVLTKNTVDAFIGEFCSYLFYDSNKCRCDLPVICYPDQGGKLPSPIDCWIIIR